MGIWRDLLTCPECGHVRGQEDSSEESIEDSEDQQSVQEDSLPDSEEMQSQRSNSSQVPRLQQRSVPFPSVRPFRFHRKQSPSELVKGKESEENAN